MRTVNQVSYYHTTKYPLDQQKAENNTTPSPNTEKKDEKLTIEKMSKRSQLAKNLLNPPTLSERAQEWQTKGISLLKKIPTALYRVVAWMGKYTLIFIQNPAIAKEWWAKAKEKTKHELKHYWAGTKLFAADVKTAGRMTRKVFQGNTLSRRERNQV
jgi:hypothetical protein